MPLLGEVMLYDAADVSVELGVCCARRQCPDAGESGLNYFLDVGLEPNVCCTNDFLAIALQQCSQADRRCCDPTFGKRHRTHAQRDDTPGT